MTLLPSLARFICHLRRLPLAAGIQLAGGKCVLRGELDPHRVPVTCILNEKEQTGIFFYVNNMRFYYIVTRCGTCY